jgi:branched-chain amino acid transport system substrate-binding protein
MIRRGRSLFVLAVAVTALAAACSSSKSSSTATTAAASATTAGGSATTTGGSATTAGGSAATCTGPGISNGTIKVGVIQTASGNPQVAADFKWAQQIVQARFNLENAKGGVNGYKLETTAADDQNSETGNLAAARKLVEADNVFGIVEITVFPGGSGDYLKGKNVPVTGWGTASDPFGKDNNVFGDAGGLPNPVPATTTGQGFMHDVMGVTNVGIIGINDPGAIAVSNADAKAAKSLGMTVGYEANVPIAQSDFTADVAKMKSAGVNGIIMYTSPVAALSMIPEAKQAGLNAKFLLSTGYDTRFLAIADKIQGVYFENAYAPFELNLPAHQVIKDAFAKDAAGAPLGIAQINAWISADLFVKGIQVAGGCPTRDSFVTNLRQVNNYDANGLISPIDESKALSSGELCFWHEIVQGKAFVTVPADGKPYCGKVVTSS